MHWQIGLTLLTNAVFFTASGFIAGPKLAARLARRESARLLTTVRALTHQLQRTTAERDDFERRAESNRLTIESVIQQRDGWCKLYDDQAIGHGNAQAIMMGVIEHQALKLRQAGIEVPLPPVIQETMGVFVQEHVDPVLKRRGVTAGQVGSLAETAKEDGR